MVKSGCRCRVITAVGTDLMYLAYVFPDPSHRDPFYALCPPLLFPSSILFSNDIWP
jgi:hypothetical protein